MIRGYDEWLTTDPNDYDECSTPECERAVHRDGLCRDCWDAGYADAHEDEFMERVRGVLEGGQK